MRFAGVPGGDLVERGLADRARNAESVESLLCEVAAPRLAELGIEVLPTPGEPAHLRLFRRLSEADAEGAFARYNALLLRLASFQRAAR